MMLFVSKRYVYLLASPYNWPYHFFNVDMTTNIEIMFNK